MPATKVERSFYPNGQLRVEVTLVNGLPNGCTRRWHPNGVLAEELSVRDGIFEGTSKRWNDKGELVGSFQVHGGTGIVKSWYDNGVLQGEVSYVDGKFTGRQRAWFEDGKLVTEVFWIRGRQVSRKRYLAVCETDSSLPRYDNEPRVETWEQEMKRLAKPRKRRATNPKLAEASARHLQELLADPATCEAREWLKVAPHGKTRTLGEIPNPDESLALVEEAYSAGAAKVLVVKIGGDGGMENSGTLVVRLPKSDNKRRQALDWCNEQNGWQGFDPEDDEGQRWVIVRLD
ncbi:MAG TPA: toxin-antitoxin system YwqK family antitoxin [Verrucomicrobiae bacterium]|nr:toxin-antitoxin system YwqK family antitoxin [Verrucomicrobiae bacterium]